MTDSVNRRCSIGRMKPEDIAAVAAIEAENFSVPWKRADFARYPGDPQAVFLTARSADGAEVLGYIGCLFAADEGDITNVSVRRDARRGGIGRALVAELVAQARLRGCRRIFLEVRASNEAAIRLYRQFGFAQTGVRRKYYTNPTEDALLMRLMCGEEDA